MFFLYFCYAKKNYVIVEVKKKMSLIMKEMLIVSSILKKTTTIKSFLNKV